MIEALFIYCYCGDLLCELVNILYTIVILILESGTAINAYDTFFKNQRIKNIVYDMPWYDQNMRTKKIFFMILLLSQKEFRLRAYKMSWIRLSFFMQLARVLYSAVQVLTNS